MFAILIALLSGIALGACLFFFYIKPKHEKQYLEQETQLLKVLNAVAMAHDNETGNHILRTQHYVRLIAERLKKSNAYPHLTPTDIQHMFLAAPLHDLGKIGIPQSILKKTASLSEEEWAVMKTHPALGEEILATTQEIGTKNSKALKMAFDISGGHHEYWNGMGYPRGLKGTEIPLAARIMSLADNYDALVNERAYKNSWTHEEAAAEILANKAIKFDPLVVDAFLQEQDQFEKISATYQDH